MKYDGQSAYVLFACDAHKQRDSMRIIGIAGDIVTLYAIIGNEVLKGDMDYRGFSRQKGFALLRDDYKNGEVSCANVDYGYYEEQPIIEQGYANCTQEWEKAYEMLNMEDKEYESLRSGISLKAISEDRLRTILDRALMSITNDYRGAELYEQLRNTLEMTDEEITSAGFDSREFNAEYDFDSMSAEEETEAEYE